MLTNLKLKKPIAHTLIYLSVSAALAPVLAHSAEVEQEAAEEEIEKIVVYGTRSSAQKSLEIRRDSLGIVDALVADDIGKFPDENLAEAIARISGVTISRTGGEGDEVNIRGLSSKYTETFINGMKASTGSDGRQFNFNILASELFSGIKVEKNHSASSIEGAIGGNIRMSTPSANNFDGRKISLSAKGSRNNVTDKTSPRLSGLYADKFMDDRLGVLFSAAYQEKSRRQESSDSTEWTHYDTLDVGDTTVDDVFVMHIPRTLADVRDYERLGLTGAIGYEITDNWEIELSSIYSQEDSEYKRFTYEWYVKDAARGRKGSISNILLGGEDGRTAVKVDVEGGYIRSDTRHEVRDTEFQLHTLDLKGSLDDWGVNASLGWSGAKVEQPLKNRYRYRTTADYSYDVGNNPKLPEIVTSLTSDTDPTGWSIFDVRVESQERESEEFALALNASRVLDFGIVTGISVGARYSDREITRFFASDRDRDDNNDPAQTEILSTTPFNDFLSEIDGGVPSTYPQIWIAPDLNAARSLFGDASTVVHGQDSARFSSDFDDNYTLGEETIALYTEVDFETEIAGMILEGNAGFRYIDTKVTTEALERVDADNGRSYVPFKGSDDYSYLLPSVNVRLDITDEIIARFSASQSFTRPDLGDLAPRSSVDTEDLEIKRGNPGLKPFEGDNIDVALEWYPSDETSVTATLFYKNISNLIQDETSIEVIDGQDFELTQPQNTDEEFKVKGVELAYQAPWTALPGRLANFGHIFNLTLSDSNDTDDATEGFNHKLQGLSRRSFNAVIYYEEGAFSARAAYNFRSNYYQRENANAPVFDDDYGQLDFSASYKLTDNIKLRFEALNINNEHEFEYSVNKGRLERYGTVGTTYTVGIKANF